MQIKIELSSKDLEIGDICTFGKWPDEWRVISIEKGKIGLELIKPVKWRRKQMAS